MRLSFEYLPNGRRRLQLESWLENEAPKWFGSNKLTVTESIANRWAGLIAQARRQGLTLDSSDGLIAATAIQHGLTLVTRNIKDFAGLDLSTLNPWD